MKNYWKSEKKNIPDQINCTYWWIIHIKKECRTNPNVIELKGYSKFQNQAEATDKIQCLCSKILMFEKNNWINRCTHIEIFKKLGTLPNQTQDRHILTIYPHQYEIPSQLLGKMPQNLRTFIENFYKARNQNIPCENLIPLPDKTKSKDDLFIVSKHNFSNVMELLNWCEKQISNGESKILVESFYKKYLPKLV